LVGWLVGWMAGLLVVVDWFYLVGWFVQLVLTVAVLKRITSMIINGTY